MRKRFRCLCRKPRRNLRRLYSPPRVPWATGKSLTLARKISIPLSGTDDEAYDKETQVVALPLTIAHPLLSFYPLPYLPFDSLCRTAGFDPKSRVSGPGAAPAWTRVFVVGRLPNEGRSVKIDQQVVIYPGSQAHCVNCQGATGSSMRSGR